MPAPDVPRMVDEILRQALAAGASDLYWLPRADGVEVRLRVDGVQREHCRLDPGVGLQCITHLKVLGGLLTYRTQVAQDGVIRRQDRDGQTELRVAAIPSLFGERLTLRVQSRRHVPLLLDELGFPPAAVAALRRMLARPEGLIVLTGPTGSGKTTTIYAMLRELLRWRQDPASILTLEDPVESVLPGVTQCPVATGNADWNYALALRAALRQDVKTLVVGELRDREVARVALDAALTGHRILATFHAGDIASVYARLLHWECEPFLVAATIGGVVAQRLGRGPDGSPVPVVAWLEADTAWRDRVCQRPGLEALRALLGERPGADLEAATRALLAAGRLAPPAVPLAIPPVGASPSSAPASPPAGERATP